MRDRTRGRKTVANVVRLRRIVGNLSALPRDRNISGCAPNRRWFGFAEGVSTVAGMFGKGRDAESKRCNGRYGESRSGHR